MKISASIYSFPGNDLEQVVRQLDVFHVDYLHVDCCDDETVFDDIGAIRRFSRTPVDLHLITPEPERYFDLIRRHQVEMFCFQAEEVARPVAIPADLRCRVGLAVTVGTDLSVFAPYARRMDFILLMTTTPGKSGGTFNRETFAAIRQVQQDYPGIAVHVDGGITGDVGFLLRNCGVRLAVSGSYLSKANSVGEALVSLRMPGTVSGLTIGDYMADMDSLPTLPAEGGTLADVLRAIDAHRMGFVMLVDADGRLHGVVSDGDIRRGMLAGGDRLVVPDLTAVTNRNPITVRPEEGVAAMMERVRNVGRPLTFVPVVDADRRLLGAISFLKLVQGEL